MNRNHSDSKILLIRSQWNNISPIMGPVKATLWKNEKVRKQLNNNEAWKLDCKYVNIICDLIFIAFELKLGLHR